MVTYNKITEVRRFDNSSSQNMEKIACIFNDYSASVCPVDNGVTPEFSERVDIHKTCLSTINFFPSTAC